MKKAAGFLLAILLCVTVFWGCNQDNDNVPTDTREEPCRVMALTDGGMYVCIFMGYKGAPEYVYVENVETDLEIKPLDTVVMQFSVGALKPSNESFADFFGEIHTCSYTLERPISVRFTTPEEPTFG